MLVTFRGQRVKEGGAATKQSYTNTKCSIHRECNKFSILFCHILVRHSYFPAQQYAKLLFNY